MAEIIAHPGTLPPYRAVRLRLWRELAFYSALLMELSWAALWSRIFLRSGEKVTFWRTLGILGGVVLLAYAVALVSERLNLRLIFRRMLLGIALLACMALGLGGLVEIRDTLSLWEVLSRPVRTFNDMANLVPVEFVVMLLVLVLGWRGISLVGRYMEPQVVIGGFRLGIVMLFLYGVVVPGSREAPFAALLLFLFSSLLAMSAARISALSALRGGQAIPFDRRWLAGILLVVGAMVAMAWVVAVLMQGAGFEVLTRVFTLVLFALLLVLSPLLWLVIRLIIWVGEWINLTGIIQGLLDLFKRLSTFFDSLISSISRWFQQIDPTRFRRALELLTATRPLLLWGTLLLAFVMVLLVLQRYFSRRDAEADEQEYEALLEQKDLFGYMRDALRRGLDRLLDELEKMSHLRFARRLLAAARIRRIYASLMDLCARLDRPRPSSRTPLEFLPSLQALFPASSADLELITYAYLRVRYGDMPETKQEVEAVDAAWKRVSAQGQDLVKSQRKKVG